MGAWEGGPVGPGPPPLGSWGAFQGLPGRGPGPKLQGPLPLRIRIKIYADFDIDFLVDLGSILAPSWRSFSVMLAPFSAQVCLGTIFEPTYLRKSDLSRNITFPSGFGPKLTPRWGQDRPKIAPRRVQDRLGSPFSHL